MILETAGTDFNRACPQAGQSADRESSVVSPGQQRPSHTLKAVEEVQSRCCEIKAHEPLPAGTEASPIV